jgi:hypothetical protein
MAKKWLVTTLLIFSSLAGAAETQTPYCAAVRGNGEAMPAHWGALAQMMEKFGAPVGMAGGSSASITTFLWESISMNPLVEQSSANDRGNVEALLMKSLEGVTYHLLEKPEWSALATWITKAQQTQSFKALLSYDRSVEFAAQLPKLMQALRDLKETEIFYGPAVREIAALARDPQISTSGMKRRLMAKRLIELKKALSVFGKFDVKNDPQIFVRAGLIDFAAMARRFGALADFMSLRDASVDTTRLFSSMIATCSPSSIGKTWNEIISSDPNCQNALASAFDSYFASYQFTQRSRAYDRVGANRRVLITTSVVKGASAARFRASKSLPLAPADLRFGYWGNSADLAKIQKTFEHGIDPLSQLDKSKRFMPLPSAQWIQALSLSPAEPGLSAALELKSVGLNSDLISFGGWSDLHPVPVLKAAGCERVVYVTRRGGDALFGIGVAKRLLNLDKPDWSEIDRTTSGNQSQIRNNNGSNDDQSSQWSMMYNLRNPKSSFAASINAADAVICTDWDAFDVKSQFATMIVDSYRSAIVTSKDANPVDPAKGFAPYAGCIPLQ